MDRLWDLCEVVNNDSSDLNGNSSNSGSSFNGDIVCRRFVFRLWFFLYGCVKGIESFSVFSGLFFMFMMLLGFFVRFFVFYIILYLVSDCFYILLYFYDFYCYVFKGDIWKLILKVELRMSFVMVLYIVSEILVILFVKDFRLLEKIVKEMFEVVV